MSGEAKNQQQKKLTYEELEAYANQTVAQAKQIYKENQVLKQEINSLRDQARYAEITLAFKVLEHKDVFSHDFVKTIINKLEEVLTPVEQKDPAEEQPSKNKE